MDHTVSRRHVLKGAATIGAAMCLPNARAQSQSPIHLIVGFPLGGSTDAAGRLLAERLRGKLGRSVVVENVAGAASRLARARVKRAAPDGTTLMFSPVGGTSLLPHLFTAKNLGYVAADYAPVARIATYKLVLAASLSVQASNMRELKTWLRSNPTLATCANPGSGTAPHLLGSVLADEMGVSMTHVAYKGVAPAIPDLIGNNVSLMVTPPLDVLGFYQSGKLRVLGTISDRRSLLLPDVPTMKEQGIELSAESFLGVWAPAGTPEFVIRPLNAAIVSVLNEPALKEEMLTKFGLRAAPSSAAELAEAEKQDTQLWGAFVKRTGISITD